MLVSLSIVEHTEESKYKNTKKRNFKCFTASSPLAYSLRLRENVASAVACVAETNESSGIRIFCSIRMKYLDDETWGHFVFSNDYR